ncbi:MAG: hypothetical protein KC616_20095 [Myxococcales bacterium]|nr:hypothetical protein [Myxococcales bacterium]
MSEAGGAEERALLEALLELASRAQLEIRLLSNASARAELAPTGSAACRVGQKVWVVLAPDDPPRHHAQVVAEALARFRSEFLEAHFVAPAVREFIDRAGHRPA